MVKSWRADYEAAFLQSGLKKGQSVFLLVGRPSVERRKTWWEDWEVDRLIWVLWQYRELPHTGLSHVCDNQQIITDHSLENKDNFSFTQTCLVAIGA